MSVTIVGLGPADGRYLTREAWEVLAAAEAVYLRTAQHPAAADLPPGVATMSFDHVYETAADFDQAYQTICDEVMRLGRRAAERGATLVYAVPGHPLIGESTTTAILAAGRAEGLPVRVVAGLSFIEPTLSALGLDGLEGLQLFDAIEVAGYNHPPLNTDRPALLGQVYSRRLANELKLALMAAYPDEHPVVLIHAAGSDAQLLEHVPLFAIDRSPQLAHLSSLYLPPRPEASGLTALAETVATLRAPEGCPWDREQTRESLAPHLLEEVGEFLASVESGEAEAICDELGDVLGHVVMQAQMAAEQGEFQLGDVIAAINAKLKRRHPHVWGDIAVADSAEVLRNWEQLKRDERLAGAEAASWLDNVPFALPALARAQKMQQRARKVGFDWGSAAGPRAKILEELQEVESATDQAERRAELGDLLFSLVNWARWLDVDAETALRGSNSRFEQRFRRVEQLAASRGQKLSELGLEALDALWEQSKAGLAAEAGGQGAAGEREVR